MRAYRSADSPKLRSKSAGVTCVRRGTNIFSLACLRSLITSSSTSGELSDRQKSRTVFSVKNSVWGRNDDLSTLRGISQIFIRHCKQSYRYYIPFGESNYFLRSSLATWP